MPGDHSSGFGVSPGSVAGGGVAPVATTERAAAVIVVAALLYLVAIRRGFRSVLPG